ncbi:hypothetical protein H257_03910 [Aphanomyces astaci]|uniref:Uncharacterized protein n=1 Tax=Aphanomyces astaci TaxID=112090 RepID=W4H0M2_APHAT|nr:hypothetical protein H257_03910 [Aphanomyces astaci]ETV84824.1 hypothetical protein H257_03910 [Aphanomyces astaci]|eukprot:XP_009826516.1 hypothetical protein H257_03910 [Aphanomyces astaci]
MMNCFEDLDALRREYDEAFKGLLDRAKHELQHTTSSLDHANAGIQSLRTENENLVRQLAGAGVRATQVDDLRTHIEHVESLNAALQRQGEQLAARETEYRLKLAAAELQVLELSDQTAALSYLQRRVQDLEAANLTLTQDNTVLRENNTELNTIAMELVARLEKDELQHSKPHHDVD